MAKDHSPLSHPASSIQHPAVLALGAGIILTAGCATPTSVWRDRPRAAYGAYLHGLMLERSAKLPDALDAYQLALEHDHRSPLLHVRLGATYVKLGQMDRALQAFERALAIEPNHPDALRWIAMLHASQGDLNPAVAAYERLLVLDPTSQFVMSTLADLYVLQGRLQHAIELYQRLIMESGSLTVPRGQVPSVLAAIDSLRLGLEAGGQYFPPGTFESLRHPSPLEIEEK